MKKLSVAAAILLLSGALSAQSPNLAKAKQLVSKMTLDEKIKLVVGMGMNMPGVPAGPTVGIMKDKVPGAAGSTFAIPKLNIPGIVVADGPAGLRIQPKRDSTVETFYCTAFPVGTLLASSWDTALVKKVGIAMGSEVKAYGVDILLAPALNIQRNALGGRNFEYYSEDPVLSGNIAAAMVNGIESNGVGTSIKHFAANNQETNRNSVNTIMSERALREIYLKGFQIAVQKSQPWTVMSSYNQINGTYTSQQYDLLTTILRKEWGFKGFVMTDWFGGKDAIAQMTAGNDLLMPGTGIQATALMEAVKNGKLKTSVIDENAARIVAVILESPSYKKFRFNNQPDLKGNAMVARNAAAEGMVLLKNNAATLPLKTSDQSIAVFGNTSYDFISGGTGSGDVNEAYVISLVDGLTNAGFKLDKNLQDLYEAFIKAEKAKLPPKKYFFDLPFPIPEMTVSDDQLSEKVNSSSIGIITIGRNAGEFQDRKKENDYYLSDAEKALIKQITTAYHAVNKKVVVILNVGGAIDVAQWRDDVDAILLASQGGQEAGNAVADIISGKVNPSGKLTATFPMTYESDVTTKNFPGKNLNPAEEKTERSLFEGLESEVVYEEGIYVGYRYFNTFNVKPAYDFGFGLSYTNFNYSNIKVSAPDVKGNRTVTLNIANAGQTSGKEVVQLYITAPKSKLDKPSEELKAFAKTNLLQPGQSQTISFVLPTSALASYNTTSSSWIADAGSYTVKAGASSTDIRQMAAFSLSKAVVTEKCNAVLKPQVSIKNIK